MKLDTYESTPQNKKPTPEAKRVCFKCGQSKSIKDFYSNKNWDDQLNRDVWCTSCVGKCSTKEEIKEYFWENHREFNEKMWDVAVKRAEKLLNNNPVYQKSGEDRRHMLLEKMTAGQIPAVMNMKLYYKYIDTEKSGSTSYAEAKANGEIPESKDPEEKKFNEFFFGYFTDREIKYLEDYYHQMEDDGFVFDNENLRDYAREVCLSSLQVKKLRMDYNAGRCTLADLKDAINTFDTLSKSSNLAACKRKAGETNGLTSWAETTMKLESTGHTMQRKIEWEKDDVDRVIDNYRHLVRSLGLDAI